jgi:hypothetical protein
VPGGVVIAFKNGHGAVEQTVLEPLPDGGYSMDTGAGAFVFESIPAVLRANPSALRFPFNKALGPPEARDLSYFNHGAISDTEAKGRLVRQPAGTFFLRNSRSTKHAIVVSTRMRDGVVEFLSRLRPDGAYECDDDTGAHLRFQNVDDLMRLRGDMFVHPLSRYAFEHLGSTLEDAVAL